MPPPMLYSPPDNPMSSLLSEIPTLSVVKPFTSVRHLRCGAPRQPPPACVHQTDRETRGVANTRGAGAGTADANASRCDLQRREQGGLGGGAADGGAGVWHQRYAVVALAGLASLAVGFGAQNLVRDMIAGFYIVLEDQYAVGDTIQVAETIGRVEHLTLRRTVVRDTRGALVTLSNGDIRTVGNLSRDWSQAFVDVAISPHIPQEHALQALDAAATELRKDPAWSQALVDGPRILGLAVLRPDASTVRLQVRTAPSRQEDVSRELRRRIQLEFQRQGIPLSNVQRVELVQAFRTAPAGNTGSSSA